MAILVLANIVHFYTVSFMTATTALKQIDPEFESVSASMRVPFYRTFARITLPLSLPAVAEIAMYLFVNSMVTVSAVIFSIHRRFGWPPWRSSTWMKRATPLRRRRCPC